MEPFFNPSLFKNLNNKDELIENHQKNKKNDIKIILDNILKKNKNLISNNEEENCLTEKEFSEICYIVLRWLSCRGVNTINWDEARKQGRKKGDGKGPWPSFIKDTKDTIRHLLNINEINKNFWLLLKKNNNGENNSYLIFLLMLYLISTEKNNNDDFIWIKPVKSRKEKTENEIEKLLYKLYPAANKDEIQILRNMYNSKEKIKELKGIFGIND